MNHQRPCQQPVTTSNIPRLIAINEIIGTPAGSPFLKAIAGPVPVPVGGAPPPLRVVRLASQRPRGDVQLSQARVRVEQLGVRPVPVVGVREAKKPCANDEVTYQQSFFWAGAVGSFQMCLDDVTNEV